MNNIDNYEKAKNVLTPTDKIGQLFMPAAFINDSEDKITALEKIIQEHCKNAIRKYFDNILYDTLLKETETERIEYRKQLKKYVINIKE